MTQTKRPPEFPGRFKPSYVLNLVYPPSAEAEKAVLELIASYKARFQQDAVLRVKANACSSL